MRFLRMMTCLLILSSLSCAVPTQQVSSPSDLLAYRDQQFPFSVMYPRTWAQVEPTDPATRFKVARNNGDGDATFNVVAERIKGLEGTSPREYVEWIGNNPDTLLRVVRRAMPDAVIIERGATYLNNREAYFVISEGTFRAGGVEMKLLQFTTVFEGVAYHLTFCCPSEDFDSLSPLFREMAGTFLTRPAMNTPTR